MNIPKTLKDIKPGRLSVEDWIKRNYIEFYNYLNERYVGIPIKEQLYLYYNKIDNIPTCPNCGKQVKFHGYTYGYAKYCSAKCAQNDKKVQEKRIETCINKYGTDFQGQIINKIKSTKKEKYGDENYNNIKKAQKTCLKRYGVDNPMKSKKILEKSKQTCLKRYGVEYALLREDYKKEARQRFDNQIKNHYSEVLQIDNNILTCSCPDPNCNLCKEKQYQISYNTFYERKFVYNICPCTIKLPLGESVTNNKNTSLEVFVQEILDKHNIEYITNARNIIVPKELDIYIPSKKLAIECNGIYWHTDKDNKYHYDKFIKCQKLGIQLLTIWEDQIVNKSDIVESIILSKLGIYKERIYARKCTIKEVDAKTSREFLDNNHLQGNVNSSIKLGLYYNDKLVSLMTFGKNRRCLNSQDNGWELYRYCNLLNTQVIGGASKLFAYFIKHYNPTEIISFSSNDISNGDLYKQLGFQYKSESISYWYIKNKVRYHRYKFRKSELIKQGYDKNKTEHQIMTELGYYIIYDTGQKKWIKTL